MNSNGIDVCVLEWCKLFADANGKHYWRKIVTDLSGFQAGLLGHLGLEAIASRKEVDIMRRYRDKFLAHLDSDSIMNIPVLDVPKKAVWFYHHHIVNREATPGDLIGLPAQLDGGYQESEREADAVYRQATTSFRSMEESGAGSCGTNP
jgi:hypothetical protein